MKLNDPIEGALQGEREVPIRSYNLMKRMGVHTVGQLLDLDQDEFLAERNAGWRSWEPISAAQQSIRAELEAAPTFEERIKFLRGGAEEMRKDRDKRWHVVADWVDLEAATLGAMEPFGELLNAAIEKSSGIKGYIRFGRDVNGDPSLLTDTVSAAEAAVAAYLGE